MAVVKSLMVCKRKTGPKWLCREQKWGGRRLANAIGTISRWQKKSPCVFVRASCGRPPTCCGTSTRSSPKGNPWQWPGLGCRWGRGCTHPRCTWRDNCDDDDNEDYAVLVVPDDDDGIMMMMIMIMSSSMLYLRFFFDTIVLIELAIAICTSVTLTGWHVYGQVSAGREKWPFNVLFFLKVGPPCDQTWWDSLVFSILSCFSYVLDAENTLVGPVGPF